MSEQRQVDAGMEESLAEWNEAALECGVISSLVQWPFHWLGTLVSVVIASATRS